VCPRERPRSWRLREIAALYRWPAIAALVHAVAFDLVTYHVFYNGHLPIAAWMTVVAFFIGLPFAFAVLASRVAAALLLPVVFLADGLAAYFAHFYKIDIRADTLAFLYETNPAEAAGFLDPVLVAAALLAAALGAALASLARRHARPAGWRGLLALIALLPPMGLALAAKEQELKTPLPLPAPIVSGSLRYFKEKRLVEATIAARPEFPRSAYRPPEEDVTAVLVIGESARPDHFALNGYPRPTTPRLAARGVTSFPRVRACHHTTRIAVPCLMTRTYREGVDLGKHSQRVYLRERSLVSVFRGGGFLTGWMSNQRVLHKKDTASTAIAAEAEVTRYSLTTWSQAQDAVLLPWVREFLDRPERSKLLVVHTIGSHWPYFNRHDAAHARFAPGCARRNPSYCSPAELVNSYDNSILYTDGFLDDVIGLLRGNAVLLYTSDHGESLGEDGVFGHGQRNRPEQLPVPLIVWTSPEFRRRHPGRHAAVEGHAGQALSHAHVFHSLLDCAGFTGEVIDPALSLCRPWNSEGGPSGPARSQAQQGEEEARALGEGVGAVQAPDVDHAVEGPHPEDPASPGGGIRGRGRAAAPALLAEHRDVDARGEQGAVERARVQRPPHPGQIGLQQRALPLQEVVVHVAGAGRHRRRREHAQPRLPLEPAREGGEEEELGQQLLEVEVVAVPELHDGGGQQGLVGVAEDVEAGQAEDPHHLVAADRQLQHLADQLRVHAQPGDDEPGLGLAGEEAPEPHQAQVEAAEGAGHGAGRVAVDHAVHQGQRGLPRERQREQLEPRQLGARQRLVGAGLVAPEVVEALAVRRLAAAPEGIQVHQVIARGGARHPAPLPGQEEIAQAPEQHGQHDDERAQQHPGRARPGREHPEDGERDPEERVQGDLRPAADERRQPGEVPGSQVHAVEEGEEDQHERHALDEAARTQQLRVGLDLVDRAADRLVQRGESQQRAPSRRGQPRQDGAKAPLPQADHGLVLVEPRHAPDRAAEADSHRAAESIRSRMPRTVNSCSASTPRSAKSTP
jgi:glucan phosphoethanolaminetransferase (alkaline phosphatase superfamily)